MKKRFSALFCIITATAVMFGGALVGCDGKKPQGTTPAPDDSTVHMYLIAGQSNASGTTAMSSVINEDLTKTFDGFIYAGETEKFYDKEGQGQGAQKSTIDDPVTPMRAGLGRSATHIGPEYGMADALYPHYSGGERKVLIFKSAAGGVALRNLQTGDQNLQYGTWYPRTAQQELPYTERYAHTGKQYDMFVANFKKVYDSLVAQGEKVRVMGMAWMQGESDKSEPELYRELLITLIEDVREDISDITGSNYKNMPFAIGEISETQGSGAGSSRAVERAAAVEQNKAFNAMLNTVALYGRLKNVSVVPSEKLQMHLEDGTPLHIDQATKKVVDPHHWPADEMVALGRMFGAALYSE